MNKTPNIKNYFFVSLLTTLTGCSNGQDLKTNQTNQTMKPKINKTEEEWKKQLTPEQYHILREKGTERPFSSKFEEHWDGGIYSCVACGNELFKSDSKFDAHCGWPSFYEALDKTKIIEKPDNTIGMRRTEITCANCGGHLGHVFDDGPKPTGLRYCVNGTSLEFKKVEQKK